tara:strand:+ start:235 stop:606 length:372 start_codon:yes stop_codon:yes gene_type:complete
MTRNELWKRSYKKLEFYFNKNGHSMVDTKYSKNKTKAQNKLGNWAAQQRRIKNKLSSDQISQLNKLNFVWVTDLRKVFEIKMCNLKKSDKQFIEMTCKNLIKQLQKSRTEATLSIWLKTKKES